MGRLRRKRPASTRKKRQKGATREDNRERDLTRVKVATPVVQGQHVPNQVAGAKPARHLSRSGEASGKEVAKAIKPSGRRFQPAFWTKAAQFLREVKIELKKVTWPSKKETMASTGVVIILVIIVSAFLGLVDVGLSSLIRLVLH